MPGTFTAHGRVATREERAIGGAALGRDDHHPEIRFADLVHDAIVSNTFWIFTDRDMVASLEPRYRAILDGTNPPEREFGI